MIFNYGDCGVVVFIVVLGYCLMFLVVVDGGFCFWGGWW